MLMQFRWQCNVNFRSAALDDDIESSACKTLKSVLPNGDVTCTTSNKPLLNKNLLAFAWER